MVDTASPYAMPNPEEPTIDRLLRPTVDPEAIITLFPAMVPGQRPYTKWEAVEWLGDLPEEHRVWLRRQFGQETLRNLLIELSGHRVNCPANLAQERAQLAKYDDYPPMHEVLRWRDTLAAVIRLAKQPGRLSKADLLAVLARGEAQQ